MEEDTSIPGIVLNNDINFGRYASVVYDDSSFAYDVRLRSRPENDILVNISTAMDLQINQSSLVFTPFNWKENQRVTVTIPQDLYKNNREYVLQHQALNYGDEEGVNRAFSLYSNITYPVVNGNIIFNDRHSTIEIDDTGTFEVRLSEKPNGNVEIRALDIDTNTLVVSPMSLTFTPDNWNRNQEVSYRILLASATYTGTGYYVTDGSYNLMDNSIIIARQPENDQQQRSNRRSVSAQSSVAREGVARYRRNIYNMTRQTPGQLFEFSRNGNTVFDFSESNSLQIPDEQTTSYWFRLASEPSTDVALDIRANTSGFRFGIGDAFPSGPSVQPMISAEDWDTFQRIRILYVNDITSDVNASISHRITSPGTIPGVGRVYVTVFDEEMLVSDPVGRIIVSTSSANDGADITSARSIDEGESDTYYVRLGSVPNSDDTEIDIRVSSEATGTESEDADISIVNSSGNSLINANGSSSSHRLTFDTSNWFTPQEVTITANVDDDVDDGAFEITFTSEVGSTSSNYNLVTKDIVISHIDQTIDPSGPDENIIQLREEESDDPIGILSFTIDENEETSFYVSLSHRPSADVTVRPLFASTTDFDEIINVGDDVRLRSGSDRESSIVETLTFTVDNYDTPQQIYIHASEDSNDDDTDYVIRLNGENGGYNNRNARVNLTVNETITIPARIILSRRTILLDEGGSNETYDVSLSVDPLGTATVEISVDEDLPVSISSGSLFHESLSLTFNTDTFSRFQTITVRPDVSDDNTTDDIADIGHSVSGTTIYETTPDVDLSVTVRDLGEDPIRELIISSDDLGNDEITAITVDEDDEAFYYVQLVSRPTSTVSVTISGHSLDVLNLGTASLSSTPDDITLDFAVDGWNRAQRIDLYPVVDGDRVDDFITLSHTASNGGYDNVSEDLSVTINDVTQPGGTIILSTTSLEISEGGDGNYLIRLSHAPTADVTVRISIVDETLISLSGAVNDDNEITFTTTDWDDNQEVIVSATNDEDSTVDSVRLTHRANGGGYNAVGFVDVTIIDVDSTDRRIIASLSSLTIEEDSSDTYTVRLSHIPPSSNSLIVDISSGDSDITVSPSSLTFAGSNFNSPQMVTVSVSSDAGSGSVQIVNNTTYRNAMNEIVPYISAVVNVTYTEMEDPMVVDEDTEHSHDVAITHGHSISVPSINTTSSDAEIEIDTTLPAGLELMYIVLPT